MDITLNFDTNYLNGRVALPASKSISNRVLIINALADSGCAVENLSVCDDTNSMLRVLCSDDNRFDVGHAGTAMRFLTAFLSGIIGKWEITGSERMTQRPVGVLVDALNRLGGRVEYLEKPGYPPLRIYGSRMLGGEIEMPASVSSQYVSALLLIAPYMEKGLKVVLKGKVVSGAYIDMTLGLMKTFGAEVRREGNRLEIAPVPYAPVCYRVEGDWSAASYFYEFLAVAEGGEICLPALGRGSVQGDARQAVVWEQLGVATHFGDDGGVVLTKSGTRVARLEYDFVEMPDLVQSFAVACCLLEVPFAFHGVETLRIKEADRIRALVDELAKLGYLLQVRGDDLLSWDGSRCGVTTLDICTYHDHRMAMAFAPAALKHPGLTIVDKEVVTKSFPGYWEEVSRLLMC